MIPPLPQLVSASQDHWHICTSGMYWLTQNGPWHPASQRIALLWQHCGQASFHSFKWQKQKQKRKRIFNDMQKLHAIQVSVSINKVFIGIQPGSFIYLLSLAVGLPHRKSWVAATWTIWPVKPKMFILWLFTEEFPNPGYRGRLKIESHW